MDDKLETLTLEYAKRFNEGFPAYQLFRGRTDEERIEIVQRCLAEGKTAYELGLLPEDEDIYF